MTGDEEHVLSRIVIERVIRPNGDDVVYTSQEVPGAPGGDDTGIPLIEALGMIELARDTVLRDAMGEIPE